MAIITLTFFQNLNLYLFVGVDLRFHRRIANVRFSSKVVDWKFWQKIGQDSVSDLKADLNGSDLIAKYDPEDFDNGFSKQDIESVVSMPEVGAVQIGGSGSSVTYENMVSALETVEDAVDGDVPVLLEPGKPEDVGGDELDSRLLGGPDFFNKPRVWNTSDSDWINGHHRYFQRKLNQLTDENAEQMIEDQVREKLGTVIPGENRISDYLVNRTADNYMDDIGSEGARGRARQGIDSVVIPESYYIVNPDSEAGRVTGASEDVTEMSSVEIQEDIRAVVADLAQDNYQGIVYIESSGALAPPEIVSAAREEIDLRGIEDDTLLAYGGGVGGEYTLALDYGVPVDEMTISEQVEEYVEAGADTVIVGNSIQENGDKALK